MLAARRVDLALTDPVNRAVLQDAIREAVLSVEYQLDSMRAKRGLEERIAASEPRLLPELLKLDSQLADLLVSLWAAQKQLPGMDDSMKVRVREAAEELRAAAARESELLFECQVALGGRE